MTMSRVIVINGKTIDIKKIQERYAPPSIWPKVLLQSLVGASSGSFFTTMLAYITQLMPFHLSISAVGLLLGASASAALVVGILALIAIPALVLGAMFAYKSYKALKKQENALQEKVNDYINTLSHHADEFTAILQQAKIDFDNLLKGEKKRSDRLLELIPYIKQLQEMLNINVIDFTSTNYKPLLTKYKAYAELKIQQIRTMHNHTAVNQTVVSHADVYSNTKRILNYYDQLTQLGFKESNEQEYRHTSRYQEALRENTLALKKAKETLPGYSNIKPHQPAGADKDSFFNAISERYKAQGAWAATKLFAHKIGNRTHTVMGGAGLIMGGCMLTLFVLNPVGVTLLATTIAVGVIALAVAGLSLYLQYGVAKEQQQKMAELENNMVTLAKVKEYQESGKKQQDRNAALSVLTQEGNIQHRVAASIRPPLERSVSSPDLKSTARNTTLFSTSPQVLLQQSSTALSSSSTHFVKKQ